MRAVRHDRGIRQLEYADAEHRGRVRPFREGRERTRGYRVFAGVTGFGAAWKKTARESDRDYRSLKLDDLLLNAPIYANLFDDEDGESYSPRWSRRCRGGE